MNFKWIDADNPNAQYTVPWFVAGSQSDPSQAVGSALTYGLRYFLLQFFQIAQLDESDPDAWRSKQKAAEDEGNRAVAAAINEESLKLINMVLEKKPEERDNVLAIVRKYAKRNGKPAGDPTVITDPAVSSKLLEDLNNTYLSTIEKE